MADRISRMLRRTKPATRRGAFVSVLAMALFTLVLPAQADGPEWGPSPFVFMNVTPDDALSDGQTVTVEAGPFPTFADVSVRQCTAGSQGPQCDQAVLATVNADASGNIGPLSVAVKRVINTGSTTFNCGVTRCSLVAFPTRGTWTQHHISFASAGTVPETTTSSPTTSPTTTTPDPSTPTTVTTTPTPTSSTIPPTAPNVLCNILRIVSNLLGGLLDGLITFLGCPPAAA